MSGGFQLDAPLCNGNSIAVNLASNGGGTTVTPSATANTKGAWTQLIASTPSDACYLWIYIAEVSANTWYQQAIDIAIGASGSEKIIASNLMFSIFGAGSVGYVIYSFPINIPAGTRISARSQADQASANAINVSLRTFDGSFMAEGVAGIESIGLNTINTDGTLASVTTTGVKGAYATLVASTTKDYCGFIIAGDSSGGNNFDNYVVDLAIGAAGSEKIIVPDTFLCVGSAPMGVGPFMVNVPAGTRLAVRACNLNGTGLGIDVTVYGLYR